MCKNIYGELDTANEAVKRVSEKLSSDWLGGTIRLRKSDIERARKTHKQIIKNLRTISSSLKEFETVAKPDVVKVEHKPKIYKP